MRVPIIATHHRMLLESLQQGQEDKNSSEMSLLVSGITFEILRDSPALVADVANGLADRSVLETAVIKCIDRRKYHFGLMREDLIKKVLDFMFGYGELQPFIDDEEVTDIDGTRYNEFVIKRKGKKQWVSINLGSEKIFDTYCKLVAIRNGGILNENDSHCRVTDEDRRLRINVSVRPRNINGPSISIRKHRMKSYDLKDLTELGMLNPELAAFMKRLAGSDASLLICGKGAAGKTTLLRAFINELPEMERVLIAESDAEIFPDKPCCIQQRIKKTNEGGRPVTLRDLIRDGLTMSLDTYCVGEIVGDEAWEFVRAAFTGHRGVATTHAESARDAFGRLLTLSKGANIGESERTIKEILGQSLDVIIHLKEFRVEEVLEVEGYQPEEDCFIYNRLFAWDHGSGELVHCGTPGKRLGKRLPGGEVSGS